MFGFRFRAGAFAFWEKPMSLRSAFLAGSFPLRENYFWKNNVSGVSVPSRGFCFLETALPEKSMCLGPAFLTGVCALWENYVLIHPRCLGPAFLAALAVEEFPGRGTNDQGPGNTCHEPDIGEQGPGTKHQVPRTKDQ